MKQAIMPLLFLFCIPCFCQLNWELRLSPQLAFGAKNTIQVPNDGSGTRVYLNKDFHRKNSVLFSPRIEIECTYKSNHFIITATFLEDRFEGTSPKDINFNNYMFKSGTDLDTKYKFNNYRIGYRYRFIETDKINFDFGAVILLRDAAITMYDSDHREKYSNWGVAPLLSYLFSWDAIDNISLITYGDGFAVKKGSAFDIFAGAAYQFNDKISVNAGYRFLEGGANLKKVYTKAFYNYISLGIGINIY